MELLRQKEFSGAFKAKRFSFKGKCVKRRKVVSINLLATTITKSEEEDKVNAENTPLEKTYNKKLASTFINDHEVKKTLANWKQIKIQRESEGESARLKLEQIQNTAHFSENIESMYDFQKLLQCERKEELARLQQIKIQHERKVARLKLEQIQNTAHFSENIESMYDFHKLIRCSFTYY